MAVRVTLQTVPLYYVQCSINMASGIPEDKSVNVWWFNASTEGDLASAITELSTFYTTVDTLYSNLVATSGHTFAAYDWADTKPRAPVAEGSLGTFSVGGAPMPTEVALCLSYQGPQESGQPQRRRRGRVYIGPLTQANNDSSGRPASAAISVLQGAGAALLAASDADLDWEWVVFSRVNNTAIGVINGWVDNEWDTQRRRGRTATTRSTFGTLS